MIVYVLSWEDSGMEPAVFSSFEKAYQAAQFIKNRVPSLKVTEAEEEEGYSILWHFEYQDNEPSNAKIDKYNYHGEGMTIRPYEVDIGLRYLKN